MKRNRILLAVIPALLLPACSRQTIDSVEPDGPEAPETPAGTEETIVITAGAPETKTTLDGLAVKWTETDAIVVNGGVSTGISLLSDGASAAFTVPATTAPYHALYPASAYVPGSYADGVSSLTVPATQTYTAGSFDPAAAILTTLSDAENVTFHHAMAYLKLTVSSESYEAAVATVQVTATGGEALSGPFTAKADGTGIVAADGGSATVVLDGGEGIALGVPIFVAIPAATYSRGITIRVKDGNYRYQDFTSAGNFTAVAGKVYPTTLSYLPDGVAVDGPVTTPAQWSAFADAVTGKTWDGRDLVGGAQSFEGKTVTIGADLTVEEFFAYANGTFQGTLDGGKHVLTANGNKWPLLATVGAAGTVKDLTVAGKFASIANQGVAGNAVIAKQNLGLIQGVTNQAATELTLSGGLVFGTIVCQNGGILKNCVNEGDITLRVTTNNSSALYGGGIAAAGHLLLEGVTSPGPADVDETCPAGTFIDCVNKGNISVSDVGGALPTKAAFGGICGVAFKDGVSFLGCRNEGSVARYDNGVGASSTTSCLGGILGRAAATHTATSLAVDAKKDANGYRITLTGCTNTGILEHHSRVSGANLVAKTTETGARKVYTGGIVGLMVGKSAAEPGEIRECRSFGTIRTGWNGVGSHVPGGIAGNASYATITDCTASLAIMSPSETGTFASSAGRYVPVVGAVVGISFGTLTVSGGNYYLEADLHHGTDNWYGLLQGLNYGSGTSFSNVGVGGSITRNKYSGTTLSSTTTDNISAENYTGSLYAASSPVAPTIGTTTWLSEKPTLE